MVGQLKKVLFDNKINVQRLDQATVDERGELSDTWSNQFTNLDCRIVEQGETEFLYQKQRIKPVEGRVVIFPGSFTHLHRGNPPLNIKYIATGWLATNTIGAMNCIM